MAISLKNRKLLWVRSGNRCAFPECDRKLVADAEGEIRQDTIVSQEAHIVSLSPDGPRGESLLPEVQRNHYDNLILLCLEHHKVVDDDPATWTVVRLHQIKDAHEANIEAALSPKDDFNAKQELLYARLIDEWVERANLDTWTVWTSWLLAPLPYAPTERFQGLDQTARWIFSRPWPSVYPLVDYALENYRRASGDLAMVLHHSAESDLKEGYRIDTFYKKNWVGQEQNDKLVGEFEWIVDLIHDLVFEVTRAAELVIDRVRAFIDPYFRVEEGRLIIERQDAGLYSKLWRPRYSADESELEQPYPGIRDFLKARSTRDVGFGEGVNEGAYDRVTPIKIGDEGREKWM